MVFQRWDQRLHGSVLDPTCLVQMSGVHWYNLSDLKRVDTDAHKDTHSDFLVLSSSPRAVSAHVMWNGRSSGADQRDFEMENQRILQAVLKKSWQSLGPGWQNGEG